MRHARLGVPSWLVWLVVLWGIGVSAVPRLAEAVPFPPARAAEATGDLETVRRLLEERVVRERLRALGVSEADLASLWLRLTDEERSEMAARADELRAGGDPVAIALAISIIVAMVVILALELIGRRVISRP